ncbi:MAG: hypothetical protein KTR18_11630 [Acidiferrobacterales bacterium]|nr:hypothetical protein [Acidiferrobacterales bacterium]
MLQPKPCIKFVSWFMAFCVMYTSTISAAMMGGSGHGHMDNGSHHEMATPSHTCDEHGLDHTDTHCVSSLHHDSHPSDQVQESAETTESTMMLCSVCALCTSIVPTLDVNLQFNGRPLPGFVSESASAFSNFSSRLKRPPRA